MNLEAELAQARDQRRDVIGIAGGQRQEVGTGIDMFEAEDVGPEAGEQRLDS